MWPTLQSNRLQQQHDLLLIKCVPLVSNKTIFFLSCNVYLQALKDVNDYHLLCVCVAQKVWIALEVIKAPYEMEEVALYGANGKPDWFWDLNPDGTVPVLVCHGGAVVYPDSDMALDSIENGSAIAIAGNSDKLLLLTTSQQTKQIQKLVQEWRTSINNMLPIGKKAVLGGNKQKLFDMLKEMDSKVVGPYLCGEQITSADCAAFPFLWRLNDEFGLDDYSNLQAWLDTCNQNEAFSKTVQSSWWWWW